MAAADNASKSLPHDWQLTDIKMLYSKEANKYFCFKLEKWVEKGNKLNALITGGSPIDIDPNSKTEPGIYS